LGVLLMVAGRSGVSDADPNVIWSIGKPDGSSDEFAPGAAKTLVYEIGKSTAGKDWRERQDSADDQAPVYRIRFTLPPAPPLPAELLIEGFFLGASPRAAEIAVNSKRGFFRIQPAPATNLDERQASTPIFARQSLKVPIDLSFLRQGENEIGISFRGDGGSFHYDAISLRNSLEGPQLTASVEPTIFFRRSGAQLKEVTEVVLLHRRPIWKATVTLAIGGASLTGESPGGGFDFGEEVIELEAPALSGPLPYELAVTTGADTRRFTGEFHPQKRWRIFAGFKIHNDIGYTDLQPHVQELDARNTDGVIDIISHFPFYKFNLETAWLADNYLRARSAARVRQLTALAAREQVGINAFYLNLMSGLCTGEEMYRSLYFAKSLQRKYGIPMKFACLTDTPSHTWFLPSLLADAGITGFALGSNQTRAPLLQNSSLNEDSPFYWEGADGRRVMSWFARSYLHMQRLGGDNPSVEHLRRTLPQFLARYRRSDYPVDAVLLYGLYTDNADIRDGDAEILKAWNQAYEFPKIIPATDAEYFAYVSKNFAGKLPTYRGDGGAYWEDGVGSTAAETALNRDSQRLLPVAEMASALASLLDPAQAYPADEFREAWKNLLFYDEHTWGAHDSITRPDRQAVKDQWEFKRAYAWRAHWAAKDLLFRSLNRLVQNISVEEPTLFVFNPDLWPRTDAVEIELEPSRHLIDLITGQRLPVERFKDGSGNDALRFIAAGVPGLGYKAYSVRRAETPAPERSLAPEAWQIESRYYRVVFDPATGGISELVDKELGRDLVDSRAPYKMNELLYVAGGEDSRILQDLVTLKPPQLEVTGQSGAKRLDNTARRILIRAQSKNVPEIETEVRVYDQIKRVDIVNRIRKVEVRSKEAVYFAFPFRVSPPELAYQVQNAFVRPNDDQLPGACRDWFATQNLVVARDAGASIAWATPDAPLVTLTDINRGLWRKRLGVLSGHVFSYVMNNYWFTNYKASQGGDFTFRYSITSNRQLPEAELARFDAQTRSPLIVCNYYDTGNVRIRPAKKRMPLAEGSFLAIDAGNAQVTAFKPAEDGNGYILRLRETAGQKGVARLKSPIFPLAAAWRTNGLEDNLSPLAVTTNGVAVPLQPRAFSTLRLVFGAAPKPLSPTPIPPHRVK
jgi:hypothetical protein